MSYPILNRRIPAPSQITTSGGTDFRTPYSIGFSTIPDPTTDPRSPYERVNPLDHPPDYRQFLPQWTIRPELSEEEFIRATPKHSLPDELGFDIPNAYTDPIRPYIERGIKHRIFHQASLWGPNRRLRSVYDAQMATPLSSLLHTSDAHYTYPWLWNAEKQRWNADTSALVVTLASAKIGSDKGTAVAMRWGRASKDGWNDVFAAPYRNDPVEVWLTAVRAVVEIVSFRLRRNAAFGGLRRVILVTDKEWLVEIFGWGATTLREISLFRHKNGCLDKDLCLLAYVDNQMKYLQLCRCVDVCFWQASDQDGVLAETIKMAVEGGPDALRRFGRCDSACICGRTGDEGERLYCVVAKTCR